MSGRPARSRTRAERLGRLVITAIFALPLLADSAAQALGYELFCLADPKLQAVWGSLLQLVGGWPLYADALAEARQRRVGRPALISLLSTVLYGAGLYGSVRSVPARGHFLAAGGLLLLGHLLEYRAGRGASASPQW
ncbi:MAG: hypothetical protein AB2385_11765 [Symbiobacterium sp.]|uniref:hypothetical protein n=1 Tax=Symbiobacterium sp. TaxID=1971213 RepID=UPI0034648096